MKHISRVRLLLAIAASLAMLLFSGLVAGGRIRESVQKLTEKKTELENEYERRRKIEDSRADYENQTVIFDADYEAMTALYPTRITQNNQILFLKGIEDEFGIRIASASYTEPEVLYRFHYLAAGNRESYSLVRSTIQFPMQLSYEEWKRFIAYIEETNGCVVIESVSADYDSAESMVDANVTISQYAVTGDDREGTEMTTEVETGGDNIFYSGIDLRIGEAASATLQDYYPSGSGYGTNTAQDSYSGAGNVTFGGGETVYVGDTEPGTDDRYAGDTEQENTQDGTYAQEQTENNAGGTADNGTSSGIRNSLR